MTNAQILFWVIAIGLVSGFYFVMFRSKWREELGDTGDLDERPTGKHPALGAGYREGPVYRGQQREDRDFYGEDRDLYGDMADQFGGPLRSPSSFKRMPVHPLDKPWRDAEVNLREHPPKETGSHPRPLRERAATITLTPRHLEHINILRRRDNKPLLNAVGSRTAIARQATAAEPRTVTTTNDWVAYLIAYAVLSSEHQQSRVACEHSIAISPDAPFNGQGGRFAGAGATSSFDAPPAATDDEAGKIATRGLAYGSAGGLAAALAATEPQPTPEPQPAPTPTPEPQPAPEPAPEPQPTPTPYSAPEQSYSPPDPPAASGGGGPGPD